MAIILYTYTYVNWSMDRTTRWQQKAKETKTKALQNQMAKSMHFLKQKQNNVYILY